MLLSTGYDACFWKMSEFIVRTRGWHTLHHILHSPSGLSRFMCAGMGLAGPDGDDSPTPQQGQNPTVRVCLLSALSWLSFCLPLSFFSDVSVHQWLMSPLRTWLIFHLQPASQLLSELSTGPHAWTHSSTLHNISSSEALWFFWRVQRLMYHMPRSLHESSHIQYSSPHWASSSACLFLSS